MIKRWIPFIVAGVMGLCSVWLMMQYVRRKEQALARQKAELMKNFQAPVEVLVARQDLPEGTTLQAEHLGIIQVPAQFKQPYATAHVNDVLGLVTAIEIAQGEQLMRNKLRRSDESRKAMTLSEVTSEGKRAITIGSDALSGVGGFLRPGDYVDIVWTHAGRGGGGQTDVVTLTLLQHVKVLAVGDQMLGQRGETKEVSGNYTVTVELTPEEAELVLFAREQGQIQLSLRSNKEPAGSVPMTPMNVQTFMASVLGAEVEEQMKPQRVVEVFKGLDRNVVSLDE